jgi:hypothetical protein
MIIHNKLEWVRHCYESIVFSFIKPNECPTIILLHGKKSKNKIGAGFVDLNERQTRWKNNYELITLNREVISRIREVLYDEGKTKRTRLAIKANVQHNRLLKYI